MENHYNGPMRQAIVTKFLGPTTNRGARVVATAGAGRMVVGWDYSLNSTNNHYVAAVALADKFGWLADGGRMVAGGLPNGDTVWVFVS